MNLLPPQNISPDGREIWDWANDLSRNVQLLYKRRELTAKIDKVSRQCGSCFHWMKSSCPYEKNINGRKQGPSMTDRICGKFEMADSSAQILTEWRKELQDISEPFAKETQ